MTQIRSRKHSVNRYLATVAAVALPAMPLIAHAQAAEEKTLKEVTVTATVDKYKRESANPKNTQALLDTPQTISVIGKDIIEEQGATSLMEALRNTPGITMQMGENGNTSAGDTFQMRGFDASSSILVDGIRDMGAGTRDTFNIEQIEVAKGPSGSDSGRGASSGYINLVSKQPTLQDASSASVSGYSQEGARGTLDVNKALGRTSALRVNLMAQDINAVDRDEVKKSGYGIAAAYGVGLSTPTRFYVLGQYLKSENVPDGGISSVGMEGFYNANAAIRSAPKVRRENFYGSVNDYEDVESQQLTAKLEHDFDGGLYVVNTTRVGKTDLDRVLTGVNGITAVDPDDLSTWTLSRSRQHVVKENEVFSNTTNFNLSVETGGLQHDLAFGAEFSTESVKVLGMGAAAAPAANLYDPDPNVDLPVNQPNGTAAKVDLDVASAYIFDTIHVGDKLLLNGGLRMDSFRIKSHLATGAVVKGNDSLASWKVGAVYKPVPAGSLYLSYGNSKTPPGTGNLSASTTGIGGSEGVTNINNPNLDPTETTNLEAGVKWDLIQNHLTVTAAYYSTEHENEFVEDPLNTGFGEQFGKRTVKGFEFGVVGKITDKWNVSAGIQTMDTEVEEGTGTGSNAEGAVTRWSPELSATFWSTYKVTEKLTLGGGARYTGEQIRSNAPGADFSTQNMPKIPEYWVADAYGAYNLTDKVTVQLNVYNLFDEDYISVLNNGGSRLIMGASRSATLTANVKF